MYNKIFYSINFLKFNVGNKCVFHLDKYICRPIDVKYT